MIKVRLNGGLGNQLFQYFFGYALGRSNKIPVAYSGTACYLDKVNIKVNMLPPDDAGPAVHEPSFCYNKIPAKNANYYGYWQSELYFKEYRNDILKIFKIPVTLPDVVSLHVRRGDYLKFPDHHPVLPIDYYLEAASQFEGKPIWVFSDDIEWCRENMPKDWRFMGGRSDIQDFFMMASCRYHIIANSSFSWWTAWINGEKVVAPNKWFGIKHAHLDTKDLIPKNWLKI